MVFWFCMVLMWYVDRHHAAGWKRTKQKNITQRKSLVFLYYIMHCYYLHFCTYKTIYINIAYKYLHQEHVQDNTKNPLKILFSLYYMEISPNNIKEHIKMFFFFYKQYTKAISAACALSAIIVLYIFKCKQKNSTRILKWTILSEFYQLNFAQVVEVNILYNNSSDDQNNNFQLFLLR